MKKPITFLIVALLLALTGCLASTNSPHGISCDFSQDRELWQMPLVCQGR